MVGVYAPTAVLVHHESVSRGKDLEKGRFASQVAWMQRRWGERLVTDPAYNPNLSLDSAVFGLASAPRLKRWSSI